MSIEALQEAIKFAEGQTNLARKIGVRQGHVATWLNRGRVPEEHCPAIETATDGTVTCEMLRTDVEWVRVNGRVDHYRVRVKAAA